MSRLLILVATLAMAAAPGLGLAQTGTKPAPITCTSSSPSLREEGFVSIGGIEQWVAIKGDDCAKPAILFLHGGPGNPLSPYADAIYAGWEKDFVLVQWDQRGAGMTFGRNPPGEDDTLTVQQMRDDGIAVATYLTRRLGKRKLILMGGSWSSVLGAHMAKARPDLFHAYLGASHIVRYRDNQTATYDRLLGLARAAQDQDAIGKLETIGPPPWTNPRNSGIVRRLTRKYEAQKTDPPPQTWWKPAPAYATPKALADYEAGDDYSYLQFVGLKGDGIYSGVDLYTLGARFELPVFVVQGAEDLVTTPEVALAWFETLQAPQKSFVALPRVGHDPNTAMVATQLEILKTRIVPLIGAEN